MDPRGLDMTKRGLGFISLSAFTQIHLVDMYMYVSHSQVDGWRDLAALR